MTTEESSFLALVRESLRGSRSSAPIVINYNCFNAPVGQHNDHVDNVHLIMDKDGGFRFQHVMETRTGIADERIRPCLSLLMEERYDDEPLFNQQNHWQAVYRILVDKGYCRDSDFDGFDAFIRRVMPEEVNKPYSKGSLKQISQTDFVRPFAEWRYDVQTSKTRRPFDRMVAVARRFKEILEENGL